MKRGGLAGGRAPALGQAAPFNVIIGSNKRIKGDSRGRLSTAAPLCFGAVNRGITNLHKGLTLKSYTFLHQKGLELP